MILPAVFCMPPVSGLLRKTRISAGRDLRSVFDPESPLGSSSGAYNPSSECSSCSDQLQGNREGISAENRCQYAYFHIISGHYIPCVFPFTGGIGFWRLCIPARVSEQEWLCFICTVLHRGGIDFVAMVVKKKIPIFSLGVITMIIDVVIIALGWPAFGDVDSVLYGVASTAVSTIVVDKILYGIAAGTLAIIITGRGKAAARQISEVTERGVTIVRGTGSYTGRAGRCFCAPVPSRRHIG